MPTNKRQHILDLIKIAGYHNDYKRFVRLYTENRISYESANKAFNLGIDSKRNGVKCTCYECNN